MVQYALRIHILRNFEVILWFAQPQITVIYYIHETSPEQIIENMMQNEVSKLQMNFERTKTVLAQTIGHIAQFIGLPLVTF